MKPPFAYYGGKMRLAPLVAELLHPHRVYLEPFMGSAAVLFAKAPTRHEVINDQLSAAVTFLRVLRERPLELEHVCALTPYARDEYVACDFDAPGIDDLEIARRFFVRCSQAFNQSPTLSSRSTWAISNLRGGGSMPSSTLSAVARFVPCARRLRTVAIDNMDALEFIVRHQTADAAMYVDPPYLGSTRSRARDYAIEFASEPQHRALATVLTAFPGHVVLSGYRSPLYDELYGDWPRIEIEVHSPASNHSNSSSRRTEVLWSNRPFHDPARLPFLDTNLQAA